jgi:hypothetical protein
MNTEKLIAILRSSLGDNYILDREELLNRVLFFSKGLSLDLSRDEIIAISRDLEEEIQCTMEIGATLIDQTPHNKKWVIQNREQIEWFYWGRYKQQLVINGFGPQVVGQMDIVTDDILGLLQNPKDEGSWQRKGLVVGHVQSGKTANYSALITKALDSGYKVVIVLAGLLNSLRKQTQGRIDFGVVGLDSSLMSQNIPLKEKLIGVGKIDARLKPVTITTANTDFKKVNATSLQTEIEQYSRPLIFVIKKNVSILKNLVEWLKSNNYDLSEQPMLLIDDEADHASINTRNDDLDPTKTNALIRELLDIFPKNVYLGYTATPFANIFINPETPEEMMSDLFPENFIMTLEAPSNYFGSSKIFIDESNNYVREVDDYKQFLSHKHNKNDLPTHIPESMKHAIRVFILVCAIRRIRGQRDRHNSMLVNVSRFTDIQSNVRILIHNYLSSLRSAITNYSKLPFQEAIKNGHIKELYGSWMTEYQNTSITWNEIQSTLIKSISPIEVIEVNNSSQAEKEIDYSARNYPNGRSLIAIGGLSLSRGITLEDLSISYFLRNSMMYDTLMQMGRWFGYRIGYEDLCRIYMTSTAKGWYEYIAEATEELRREFIKMGKIGKSPMEFGLAVRNHPDSLIITARNKMRSSQTIVRDIDLDGAFIQTNSFYDSNSIIQDNLMLGNNLVQSLNHLYTKRYLGTNIFWSGVNYTTVHEFVESYKNHPKSSLTDSQSVAKYVNQLADELGYKEWNIIFVNPTDSKSSKKIHKYEQLKSFHLGLRNNANIDESCITLNKGSLFAGVNNLKKIDVNNSDDREIPALFLQLIDCRDKDDVHLTPHGLIGYGIAFPGTKSSAKIKKLATYQVNTVWMRKQYEQEIETDDDLGDDL